MALKLRQIGVCDKIGFATSRKPDHSLTRSARKSIDASLVMPLARRVLVGNLVENLS